MTPAQAYGHPKFVTDVPVQGPTDEGLRAADCIQQQRLPAHPGCVDCGGVIPMWAQQAISTTRGQSAGAVAGFGERLSFGGSGVLGFALEYVGDPEVWTKLTPDQQMWVTNTLNKLNDIIVKTTGAPCPTWGPAINLAGGCFQGWYNANYGASGASRKLRSDGVFDQDTLDALIMIANMRKADFPTPFPAGAVTATQVQPVKKPLSKGAMIGIGAAGVGLVGIVYAATRGGKARRRRRR